MILLVPILLTLGVAGLLLQFSAYWILLYFGLAVASLVLVLAPPGRYNTWQYLSFLRFQALGALILVSPLLLITDRFEAGLSNLFTLTPVQIVATTILAAFAAWSLVFSGEVAWDSAERRHNVPFRKPMPDGPESAGQVPHRPIAALLRHKLTTSLVLLTPLFWMIVRFSSTDGWTWLEEDRGETHMQMSRAGLLLYGLCGGTGIAVLARNMFYTIRQYPILTERGRRRFVIMSVSVAAILLLVYGALGGNRLFLILLVLGTGIFIAWLASRFRTKGDLLKLAITSVIVASILVVLYRAQDGNRLFGNLLALGAGIFIAWLGRRSLEWLFVGWLPKVARAASYLLVALTLYTILHLSLRPSSSSILVPWISGLGYMLFLFILIILLLYMTARVWDRHRISAVLVVVLTAIALHQIFRADNFFPVVENELAFDVPLLPKEAYAVWARNHPSTAYPIPVFVAATGGGVGASYWTTHALTELQEGLDRFGPSIAMVSASSGGALGSALYVGAFRDGEEPSEVVIPDLQRKSGTPTLASVAWGIALPDLLRAVSGGFWPGNRLLDRGWALEQGWERAGVLDQDNLTLAAWRRDVREGRRPVVVFNGVVAQSGAKLLISPMDLDGNLVPECGDGPVSFRQLYPGLDLDVRTAVRLSNSAPWVMPLSRPAGREKVCHMGDGGYVDGTGVWSLVEYLKRVGPDDVRNAGEGQPPRGSIAIVELRGFRQPRTEGSPGTQWWWGSIGPVVTLLHSNLTSQPARDAAELELLTAHWAAHDVKVYRFVLHKDVPSPWFWGLTDNAHQRILDAWCSSANQAQLSKLETLWLTGDTINAPVSTLSFGCAD